MDVEGFFCQIASMIYDLERETDQSNFGRWLLAGLILSLLLHGWLLWLARGWEVPRLGEAYYEKLVPRKFRVEPVQINPDVFTPDEPAAPAPPSARVLPVELPPETVSLEAPTQTSPAPRPAPIDPSNLETPETAAASAASSLETLRSTAPRDTLRELEDLRKQLAESDPTSAARPALPLPTGSGGDAEVLPGLRFGAMDGYSDLDSLLQQTGPLDKGTAPIFMPGDVLFEYDEADLKPEAIVSLKKLGQIIQRNPQIRFLIEGHTDSFGPEEYNLGLSQRRAESVKNWLVEQMGIGPEQIRTRGLGSTKLLIPPSNSIREQAPNRRVEILLESVE